MTQKTVVFPAPRTAEILTNQIGEPGPGEVAVRTLLSGMSIGTELAVYRGEINNLANGRWGYWNNYPISPGYELVGEVTKCGEGVTQVQVGDRVVCLEAHATATIARAGRWIRVPDQVSNEEASLAVLGATTTRGIRRARITYGERVLVLGLGVVGMLSALHAKRSGCRQVVVADPLPSKRQLAAALGLAESIDPTHPEFEAQIAQKTDGHGIDLAIEASGRAAAVQRAFEAVNRGGRILMQGTHTEPVTIHFSDYAIHKETTIVSTWSIGPRCAGESGYEGQTGADNLEFAMELIRRGDIPAARFVTHHISFERLPETYAALDEEKLECLQMIVEY